MGRKYIAHRHHALACKTVRCLVDALLMVLLLATVFLALPPIIADAQSFEENVLYQESFNDNQAQDWELERGWVVDSGMLNGRGHAWARYTRGRWGNGRVTFRFWLISMQGVIHANVRMSGAARYAIGLRYPGKEELSLYLFKQLGPDKVSPTLAQNTIPYIPRQPYMVEIVTEGGHIQVYLRKLGQESVAMPPIIDYADPDPLPPGTIAFETLDGSFAQVDDIMVTSPPAQIPPTPTPTPPARVGPDLTILSTDYWFEDDGRALVLSVGITNRGNAGASGTIVDIRDQVGGLPGGSSPVPRLGDGGTATVEVRLEVPDEQRGTAHTFLVEVDPEERIRELNEENNRQTVNVRVPDIEVPEPDSRVPWHWIIPASLAGVGAGFFLRKWFTRPKIQLRPQKDIGTQQIESDTPIRLDSEVRLRPVQDPGKQDIQTQGSLIIDKRSEES